MPTQKRETGKNYIGLVSDEIEEPRGAEPASATDRRMKAYVLGLMAAMFGRRAKRGSFEGLTPVGAHAGLLILQNAYQHFREQARPALYRAGISCSNWCKSPDQTGLQLRGERPS